LITARSSRFSAEVAPSRPVLAVAAALVVANVTLFVLIAEDVLDGGGLISHDEAVLAWFVDHRTDRSIRVAKLLSTLGAFLSLAIVSALIGIWLWRRGSHVLFAAAPLVSISLGSLASTAAKSVFERERPPVSVHATHATLAAFPSGHATNGAAFGLAAGLTLALAVAHHRWSKGLLIAGGLLFAGLVGLSRLVLAVHWLSDVVAGWALGSSVALTVVFTTWFLTTRSEAAPPAPSTHAAGGRGA
jgi:membrane-associated phospholipid phosphatase